MYMKVDRFTKDDRLKATAQHEDNSYFWKSDLTECLVFENEKLRIEVLLMIDWWNRTHHEEFDRLWKYLRFHFLDKFKPEKGNKFQNRE